MTDLSTQPALEPCERCGSAPISTENAPGWRSSIVCETCGRAQLGDDFGLVVVAWNTRPTSDRETRLEAALRRYGRHDTLCGVTGGYDHCTCGLDDARQKDVTP